MDEATVPTAANAATEDSVVHILPTSLNQGTNAMNEISQEEQHAATNLIQPLTTDTIQVTSKGCLDSLSTQNNESNETTATEITTQIHSVPRPGRLGAEEARSSSPETFLECNNIHSSLSDEQPQITDVKSASTPDNVQSTARSDDSHSITPMTTPPQQDASQSSMPSSSVPHKSENAEKNSVELLAAMAVGALKGLSPQEGHTHSPIGDENLVQPETSMNRPLENDKSIPIGKEGSQETGCQGEITPADQVAKKEATDSLLVPSTGNTSTEHTSVPLTGKTTEGSPQPDVEIGIDVRSSPKSKTTTEPPALTEATLKPQRKKSKKRKKE
eukprot:m.34222 g.34222  ORF g.34222 m.34222 type:complete len:330 (+) comp8692_c0_seq1:325-1314(+)